MKRFPVLVILLVLVACGGDSGIAIEQVWARPTAPSAANAAFYATIENDTDANDRLIAMTSPACDVVELHRSEMQEGVMSMRAADSWDFEVLKGNSLELEPGGLHLMCIGLREPLLVDETTELALTFENHGQISIEVAIEDR